MSDFIYLALASFLRSSIDFTNFTFSAFKASTWVKSSLFTSLLPFSYFCNSSFCRWLSLRIIATYSSYLSFSTLINSIFPYNLVLSFSTKDFSFANVILSNSSVDFSFSKVDFSIPKTTIWARSFFSSSSLADAPASANLGVSTTTGTEVFSTKSLRVSLIDLLAAAAAADGVAPPFFLSFFF